MDPVITLNDIAQELKGAVCQRQKRYRFGNVVIDSRMVKKNDVFVAIEGNTQDGHKYISQAIKNGACAVIVSQKRKYPKDIWVIRVHDTTRALGEVSALYRQHFNIPVVAITGSCGKTTTKDILSAVLQRKFKVLKNKKSENNQWGVPLTLFKLKKSHQVAVLELGTNQRGDIRGLTKIAKPTIAIFTNIGFSHLQGLKNEKGVFKEKLDLIRFMESNGCVIFNADDLHLSQISSKRLKHKKISYGSSSKSDVSVKDIQTKGRAAVGFNVLGKKYRLNSGARHNVINSLAVISCAKVLGVGYHEIYQGLLRFKFDNQRCQTVSCHGFLVIDDTYNSNPPSFCSALELLSKIIVKGKKILICADMLELGARAERFHKQMAVPIIESGVDCLLTYGSLSSSTTETIHTRKRVGSVLAQHMTSFKSIEQWLKKNIKKGDVVLVKGSRAMKMETIVSFLKSHKIN